MRPSLLFIIVGFSFLWGQKKYTASADLTIPAKVARMTVKVWGAGGGSGGNNLADGGAGGFAQATILVTPGDVYRIVVGKPGGYRNFRDEEGSRPGYFYPQGDSVWISETWFYGTGGCGPGIDSIGCGSMSNANLWPQVGLPEHFPGWNKASNGEYGFSPENYYRWPTLSDGSQYPVGYVLKTPKDSDWNTWSHNGPANFGSGGQMSAVYNKLGSNPDTEIDNYVVIAGGGGGGLGTYKSAHGGAGGGAAIVGTAKLALQAGHSIVCPASSSGISKF